MKCVVTGDGAVGKVWPPDGLWSGFEDSSNLVTDMPPHILYNQRLSRRVHTYRVSQASVIFG